MAAEFFQTVMGKKYYEGTLPSIAKSLEVIAKKMSGEPTERELKYKKLLISVVEKAAENNTLSEQVAILRGYGFSDDDLKEFGYSEANLAGREEHADGLPECLE